MTGKDVYDLLSTRVGCKYVLGSIAPKDNENYMGPFDCAEFASWGVFQCYKILYGCNTSDVTKAHTADAYTGFWNRDAKSKGIIIPVKKALGIKGAFILRIGGDGLIGHIVCSDGNAHTVEANSTKYGCIFSTTENRRFDIGVLIPGVTYQENAAVSSVKPTGIVYRYTKPLMPESPVVERIQDKLTELGYYHGKEDGLFGLMTMNAVVAFQKAKGLTPDGEVYTKTAAALGVEL